jgi:hypothetical protein
MTPKFYARSQTLSHRGRFPVVDTEGNKYTPIHSSSDVVVGELAYLGKRVNNYHGEFPVWELWEITIERDPLYNHPKVWYGFNRFVFRKIPPHEKLYRGC